MNKYLFLLLFTLSSQSIHAKQDSIRIQKIEAEYKELQQHLIKTTQEVNQLSKINQSTNERMEDMQKTNQLHYQKLDSLQKECNNLGLKQSADRNDMQSKLQDAHTSIENNQALLENRTVWGIVIVLVLVCSLIFATYWLTKRIKSGNSTIDKVRKAQESLATAQARIQEESVKLDNKLLEIAEKQLTSANASNHKAAAPDHSLVVKLADEIARIETNLSKMAILS